jgi:hypothetical protein
MYNYNAQNMSVGINFYYEFYEFSNVIIQITYLD